MSFIVRVLPRLCLLVVTVLAFTGLVVTVPVVADDLTPSLTFELEHSNQTPEGWGGGPVRRGIMSGKCRKAGLIPVRMR